MANTAQAGTLCCTEFGMISVCLFITFRSSRWMIPSGSYSSLLSVSSNSETFLEKSKGLEKKDRILSDDDRRIIEEEYDFELHNEIVKRARV